MPRVKRGVTARARHKKLLALSKGYSLRANNVFRVAKEAVMRGAQYAYRDRRAKKRVFRRLWIARINAATRQNGMTYSAFINGLHKAIARCSLIWLCLTRKALLLWSKRPRQLVLNW